MVGEVFFTFKIKGVCCCKMKKEKRGKKYGDYIAIVSGKINSKKVDFKLRYLEVKHIRRCLGMYDKVHSRIYPNAKNDYSLTIGIYDKFKRFGKMNRRMNQQSKNNKMDGIKVKCSFPGCGEKNVTISHKIPLSSTMNHPNSKENLEYLCPKHHLLKELKTILWQKGLEIDKLKQRISDVENKSTTDCLGYQTRKNDFDCIDK